MAITTRAWIKRLKKRLEDTSKHAFQRACFELLNFAWPDLQYAPDLGLHDQRGADLFSFGLGSTDTPGWDYDFVVQCEGRALWAKPRRSDREHAVGTDGINQRAAISPSDQRIRIW
ncbi:MAG: hypothetical protein ACHQ9S_10050 [Candidatus Binatia bacterium]